MRMWMVMPAILKLVSFYLIVFALPLQGSTEATLGPSGHGVSFTGNPPSPTPRQTGSFSPPEIDGVVPASSPSQAVPAQENFPASPPSPPLENAPVSQAPLPVGFQSHAPSIPPADSRGKDPLVETPSSIPVSPVPTPSRISPQVSPVVNPSAPMASPPSDRRRNSSYGSGPVSEPITPVSAVSPPLPPKEPNLNPPVPAISSPSRAPESSPTPPVPGISSPSRAPQSSPTPPESSISPVVAPSNKNPEPPPPMSQIPEKNDIAPAPSNLLPKSHTKRQRPALSPRTSFKKPYNPRNKNAHPIPAPSYPSSPPPTSEQRDPAVPPSPIRARKHGRYPSPPGPPPPISDSPIPSPLSRISLTPAPSQRASSGNPKSVFYPATPPASIPEAPPLLPPFSAFPPPPPNQDCSTTICTEPYTNTPPGSPCSCVLPIQVGLRLSVSLYTFFPLVSELAQEIAAGVYVKQSQVRIIGANAANEQTDKTVVLVDLVPLGEKFDNTTAFWTYQRFWNKQVTIRKLSFGDYQVLYVRYPGLPEHPPSGVGMAEDGPYPGANDSGITRKPLGVDVPKIQRKNGLSNGVIAVLVLSSSLAVIFCATAAWIFIFRRRDENSQPKPTPHVLLPSISKPSVGTGSVLESRDSSATLSFGSSIATYTGSAKTFSASEIERATEHFKASRVIGEGGFGRVYSGVLGDGTEVAVKVLKRDDQQGAREFLAEVEMLGRLHHRNLVKLIGICVEDRARCLLYELISNGSVESHLHGVDKESAPLNWGARVKIALGAARGLAYLHEDSSPRVIHRDFKSSNILLEDDFTPKVSDFGLARAALDEENQHISTRVMGTFGYVAPEYAMTGHLLVKSDVYSYGVVLLELLTGRKPVDMSQPAGEENLVSWARPLLTGKESLEAIIDWSLGPDPPLASAAKVAAIASMCVQPEVSNRPFMGEVVQALKLVFDEVNEEAMEDEQSQCSVHSYERGMSASELFRGPATEDSESFRRHSSSGPLGGARRSGQLWERTRTFSGGSAGEHSLGFRLWQGSS